MGNIFSLEQVDTTSVLVGIVLVGSCWYVARASVIHALRELGYFEQQAQLAKLLQGEIQPPNNSNPLDPNNPMSQQQFPFQQQKQPKELKVPPGGYTKLGGMQDVIDRVKVLIDLPLKYPQLCLQHNYRPPSGVLLKGPPGAGKTALAYAIASDTGANFIMITPGDVKGELPGMTEQNLKEVFDLAFEKSPALLFIDELDSLAPKRTPETMMMDTGAVAMLCSLLDQVNMATDKIVMVLAATNRADQVDMSLRRPGRLEHEIDVKTPDEPGRIEILQIYSKTLKLEKGVKLKDIAQETPGFTGADLCALCKEAQNRSVQEHLTKQKAAPYRVLLPYDMVQKALQEASISKRHFMDAVVQFQNPSALRDVSVEVPKVSWDDVGGLVDVKRELKELVQYPVLYPDKFAKFGRKPSRGVLFYGPPGCGKTLLAKAVAKECQANFISVKGPELKSKWVGESASNIRGVFAKARQSAPCIIFFDEIDAIAAERSESAGEGSGMRELDGMLTQMLAELDGIDSHDDQPGKTIFVIAATNRPDIMDRALLRPGRLDELILIPLPDAPSRLSIFKSLLRNSPISPQVDWDELVQRTEGFSGADIAEVCNKVCKAAIRESIVKEERRRKGEIVLLEETEEEEWEEDPRGLSALNQEDPNAKQQQQQQQQQQPVENGNIQSDELIEETPNVEQETSEGEPDKTVSTENEQVMDQQQLKQENGVSNVDLVPYLTRNHFDQALKQARRSVSKEYAAKFEAMAKQIKMSGSFNFKPVFDPLRAGRR
eukprot:TRINITY_DN8950_c1_g5_i1.p1 TRINITY_DN8950_c1_g5~~TRINITY_DN8950_c1_g5_i1.p1  ORF type:complete len:794 (-),score=154.10 TRINITY_DN8950_c1_g5_i1:273-2591(-)